MLKLRPTEAHSLPMVTCTCRAAAGRRALGCWLEGMRCLVLGCGAGEVSGHSTLICCDRSKSDGATFFEQGALVRECAMFTCVTVWQLGMAAVVDSCSGLRFARKAHMALAWS